MYSTILCYTNLYCVVYLCTVCLSVYSMFIWTYTIEILPMLRETDRQSWGTGVSRENVKLYEKTHTHHFTAQSMNRDPHPRLKWKWILRDLKGLRSTFEACIDMRSQSMSDVFNWQSGYFCSVSSMALKWKTNQLVERSPSGLSTQMKRLRRNSWKGKRLAIGYNTSLRDSQNVKQWPN